MSDIGVLLVEDDDATRRRLQSAVEYSDRCHLIAVASTFAQARKGLLAGGVDVLVTDLRLPDGDGIDLVLQATHAKPMIPSLVITVLADRATAMRCLGAGANGYLLKDAHPLDVNQAIVDVHSGGAPLSPEVAGYLLTQLGYTRKDEQAATTKLPPRELEVLRLISRGFAYHEIAEILLISPHTVKTYLKRTYRRLDVGSRTAALYEARQLGILDASE